MNDQEVIKELEKILKAELKRVDKISRYLSETYSMDDNLNVISLSLQGSKGLNLSLIIPLLEKLSFLQYLDISFTDINNITLLGRLLNITQLDIAGNNITDISPLKTFRKLTSLNANNNDIYDIGVLKYLIKLKSLNLSDTKIRNIDVLSNLKNIQVLNLSRNQIDDFQPLKELTSVKFLYLHNTFLSNLTLFESLSELEGLYLVGNNIVDISVLKRLKKLKDLFIGNNQIEEINALSELLNLERLYIPSNLISDISSLKGLEKLHFLDLRGNPIKRLPNWITSFQTQIVWTKSDEYMRDSIILYENPIEFPPIEIIKKGRKAIERFFKKIESEGVDFIYEAKLTLVGEGNAGKTSLQRRLINEKATLPRKDKRTRGIEILDWKFKIGRGKTHIAHIWDFGGQDVYYPVHRFFITENSVFVLLASTRQTHHNFDYWIPTIYQFGGKSPIILGQTCHDGNHVSWNDLGVYISNSNFNIIKTQLLPYYEINLLNKNEGLRKIKQTIINQITNLPHYGKGVPTSWIPVRNFLIEEAKLVACISFERFIEISRNSSQTSFAKVSDVIDCCQFLHDIGVVIWYSTNEELKNWVILQPEWAMNAVYKIIDDEEIQKRQGNIIAKDFKRLWQESLYENKHNILKKMLEVFKIAFPKKHKQDEYIIPARLLSIPSEKEWKKDEACLRLQYQYQFMPRGMINQVSAELSRYIASENEVWNNAVNLCLEENRAYCQVVEDFFNRKITIKAKGKDGRSLIILVMNSLKNITEGYKGVSPEIHVPCICAQCEKVSSPTTFSYEKLLSWSEKRDNATVICNESGNSILIEELLDHVGLQGTPKKIENTHTPSSKNAKKLFVSYSKFDEDYLEDFQDHLVTLKSEGLITFDCREIEFGKEWDKEIKKKIEECDIIVCLVSVKFLNTEYITKIEIPKAIELNKIIIPIIIKACDWESSDLGKYQAAQRGKIVSLDNDLKLLKKIKSASEEEKAAFWTAIIKEMRKKIFN